MGSNLFYPDLVSQTSQCFFLTTSMKKRTLSAQEIYLEKKASYVGYSTKTKTIVDLEIY
jgi:hypothetical protein